MLISYVSCELEVEYSSFEFSTFGGGGGGGEWLMHNVQYA